MLKTKFKSFLKKEVRSVSLSFRNIIIFITFLVVVVVFANDPLNLLRKNDRELKAILKDMPKQQQDSAIQVLVEHLFDFAYMGKKSLGKKKYDSLTSLQQKKFLKLFPQVIIQESIKQLKDYKSDSLIYGKIKILKKNTTAKVEVFNYYAGEEISLIYKMYLTKDKKWKAWDLITDDLSTYRSYREQFKRILAKNDFDYLLNILQKKLNNVSK